MLVHPVMMPRQRYSSGPVVLGPGNRQPVWLLAALGVTVVFGVLRVAAYRCILSRRVAPVPRTGFAWCRPRRGCCAPAAS